MSQIELGAIGNGTIACLIDEMAGVQWMCLPRIDGDPIIDGLVGGDGRFAIILKNFERAEQNYGNNSAILITTLYSNTGDVVRITDFCPRYEELNEKKVSIYAPMVMMRKIEIISGAPVIKIIAKFQSDWARGAISKTIGSHHICYKGEDQIFHLSSTIDAAQINDSEWIRPEQNFILMLGPHEKFPDDLTILYESALEKTRLYWRNWARSLSIPYEWQKAVIRAAITLKLCVFEKTGGIVAALTTSLPEHKGSERNWDYRYCWLRDAYFVVTAFNQLSDIETLGNYVGYVRNIIEKTGDGHIQPVFGIGFETDISEKIIDTLPGFKDHKPVRCGNQAHEHVQHDVYGQVILAAAQPFFDERLYIHHDLADFEVLENVGNRAYTMHNKPDAGLWEFRAKAQVHTFSAIMCWAACDRLAKIADLLELTDKSDKWRACANDILAEVMDKGYNKKLGSFTAAFDGDTLDASVLLMVEIGFIEAEDPKYIATVNTINDKLRTGNHVFRYKEADDFGEPETAFTACTFWLIDALYRIGRTDEAREMFEYILTCRTKLGLLSEDIDPETDDLWGNFPQTYCMVGIINSAALLSKPWRKII